MAAGLQVWNAAGDLILDTTTFTGHFLGRVVYSATGVYHILVPKQAGQFAFAVPLFQGNVRCGVTISNNGSASLEASIDVNFAEKVTTPASVIIYYGRR